VSPPRRPRAVKARLATAPRGRSNAAGLNGANPFSGQRLARATPSGAAPGAGGPNRWCMGRHPTLEYGDMRRIGRRRRPDNLLVLGLGALWPERLGALNPALDVSESPRSSWKICDGFDKGIIHAVAHPPGRLSLAGHSPRRDSRRCGMEGSGRRAGSHRVLRGLRAAGRDVP
jgi:hypothetical protein